MNRFEENIQNKLNEGLMLQKVVKWEDGIAFLALMTQQHLSSSGGLGTAPLARLWALGTGEKYTAGKEQSVLQPPAPLPHNSP